MYIALPVIKAFFFSVG